MLAKMPRVNVTANPRSWSVPIAYSTNAVITVVRFESTMADMALSKPLRIAIRRPVPRAISSRSRS